MEFYLNKSGFKNIAIETKEVSEEYAAKWGHNLNVGEYIMSSIIVANK
nr:hypothetical protein [Clostridioides mangenotii]